MLHRAWNSHGTEHEDERYTRMVYSCMTMSDTHRKPHTRNEHNSIHAVRARTERGAEAVTWHVLRVYYVWVLWSRDSTCAGARRASIPQIPTRIPQIPQIPTRRSRWLPGPYHQWRLQTPFPAECLESQRVEDPPVRDREGSGRGDREDDACPPAHAEIPQRDAGWERLVWDADHSAGGLDPTLDPVAGAGEAESEGVLYCVLDLVSVLSFCKRGVPIVRRGRVRSGRVHWR
mmetsp:Transcript_22306/g.50362  ORF Transcript_22306/g.50362 Transcript_22306/m.50362 type:complete len:232 (+) Transcript_22306:236-931(+)